MSICSTVNRELHTSVATLTNGVTSKSTVVVNNLKSYFYFDKTFMIIYNMIHRQIQHRDCYWKQVTTASWWTEHARPSLTDTSAFRSWSRAQRPTRHHLGHFTASHSLDWYWQTKQHRKIQKLDTKQKPSNRKYSKSKLHGVSCLIQHSARRRGRLILQAPKPT